MPSGADRTDAVDVAAVRAPDLTGVGRAWRIDTAPGARREPAHVAGLRSYLLNGPWHPAWSWWLIGCVHLRPIEGVPPAHLTYPEAEYELQILSLNPDRPVNVDEAEATGDWGDKSIPKFLTPPDLVYQFHGVTDAQAGQIADSVLRAIVDGGMSPDSDFRSSWVQLLDNTVAHYRSGGHGGYVH